MNETVEPAFGSLWELILGAGEFRLGYPAAKALVHPENDGPLAPMTTAPILESEDVQVLIQPQGFEPAAFVEARIGTGAFKVISGDIRALDREKIEEIVQQKLLRSSQFPEAVLRGGISPAPSSREGILFEGTLTLAGRERPVRFVFEKREGAEWEAWLKIRQSDFGIVPQTAFLGALRSRDLVELRIHLSLEGL